MPNLAPPAPRHARRRVVDTLPGPPVAADVRPGPPPATARRRNTGPAGGADTVAPTLPASWAGLDALLGGAGDRVSAEAFTLAASAECTTGHSTAVDLSGMWVRPAAVAPLRGHTVLRTLDTKGRLQLPVTANRATKLLAERDGALLVVFLPQSDLTPRAGFTVAPLPLDARGRLTLTAGARDEAGIPDRADVLAYLDPDARTVTITAASRLETALVAALDALRRNPNDRATGPAGAPPLATNDADPDAGPVSAIPDCAASVDPDGLTRSGACGAGPTPKEHQHDRQSPQRDRPQPRRHRREGEDA